MMLFLSGLSLLALRALEVSVLESKMAVFHQNKIKSFYLAEKYLLTAEQNLLISAKVTNVDLVMLDSGICGVDFYRLTANASYNGAKSSLQSVVAKVKEFGHCHFQPKIIAGRQSFLVKF